MEVFMMVHSPQHLLHIQLLIGLLSSFGNLLTVCPFERTAAEHVEPLEKGVLDVGEEMEVLFMRFGSGSVGVGLLADHQFVAVEVVGVYEEGEEDDDDFEQSPDVGESVINFSKTTLD